MINLICSCGAADWHPAGQNRFRCVACGNVFEVTVYGGGNPSADVQSDDGADTPDVVIRSKVEHD